MKNLAIIGSSKIAQIHYKFLKNNNFYKIFFISRDQKKMIKFLKQNDIYDAKFFLKKNFLKRKFDIISLCNHTDYRKDYLDFIKYKPKLLIVEKPIISLKIHKNLYKSYIQKIYKKFNTLMVVYPMTFLAKSIYNLIGSKKTIYSLKINYFTPGSQTYDDNFLDLSPHAFSFFHEICRLNKIKVGKIIKIKKKVNKKNWNGIIYFKNIKLYLNFKKISKNYKSKFFVEINDSKVERLTINKNNIFKNYLKFHKKKIEVENPMKFFFEEAMKSINQKKYFFKNRKLTIWLMNLTYQIYEQNN